MSREPQRIVIAGETVEPGQQRTLELPLAALYTHHDLPLQVHVINGKRPGPVLFVSAALHGDEINGVEIIRRLLRRKPLQQLRGALIVIPVVNVYGFLAHSRYLPDGRDLNRSFPGSPKGSLAARMAHTFLTEIVHQCTHGVDLHTGARHRANLPQVRADLDDTATRELAVAFGVPVLINSQLRDGSLREAAREAGIPMLLYEAGEALRFDEVAIRAGVGGILRVLRALKMIPESSKRRGSHRALIARQTSWVRAPQSGIVRMLVPLGALVNQGNVLGMIADPLGTTEVSIIAPRDGIVIGRSNLPLAHAGDALFHLAYYRDVEQVAGQVETFQELLEPEVSDLESLDLEQAPIL